MPISSGFWMRGVASQICARPHRASSHRLAILADVLEVDVARSRTPQSSDRRATGRATGRARAARRRARARRSAECSASSDRSAAARATRGRRRRRGDRTWRGRRFVSCRTSSCRSLPSTLNGTIGAPSISACSSRNSKAVPPRRPNCSRSTSAVERMLARDGQRLGRRHSAHVLVSVARRDAQQLAFRRAGTARSTRHRRRGSAP